MDIGDIGMQLLNSSYVPFASSSSQMTPNLQQGGGSTFEELLKKAENKQTASVNGQVSDSSRIVKNTPIDKNDRLYELCMELETFLIKNLLKSMRNTVQKTGLIDTGFAGEMYEDMLYDEYAKVYSRNANFGFAEMAYRELRSGS